MKKLLLLIVCAVTISAATAQKAEWKEMHDFHGVMSKTFHPAEEGKLQPLKDSAAVLVQKAVAWQHSTVPEGYDAGVIAPILKKLVTDCEAVTAGVKNKQPDATLVKLITRAHDTFHQIMEKCNQ